MQNLSTRDETVRIRTQHLRQGGNLLDTIRDDGGLLIVYGEGGGCTFNLLGGAAGLWVPIRGAIRVSSKNVSHTICAKEALIAEYDTGIKAIGTANSRWLAILGADRAWAALLVDAALQDTQLLPEFLRRGCELRRKALAIARSASQIELESAVCAIADEIAVGQTTLRAAIARCPGRTYAKRRRVFVRLQRVRNFMSAHCDEELDNVCLARMANYSPCHFLRTFNTVFLETPHAYLVQLRLHRAKKLLHSGKFAVNEVALSSGFESRSAFSRLFRQRFGITAREATHRRLIGAQS